MTPVSFLVNGPEWLILVLDDFAHELLQLATCLHEDLAARRRRLVILPSFSQNHFGSAAEIAQLFQQMKRRIKRSLTETVIVSNQFFGDFRAVNRLLGRVVQDVQADKTIKKMPDNGILRQWSASLMLESDVGF